ncbi:hypothetical protein TSAR_013756 [Trichomalopsis sarcophagae]|uniref:Uncharacterized protein n=1 Tax=Trichomalopsis sarcophagae TaxID=543379 RepID=A0A232FNE8_9HYME|nr:hypothetical protein TSAR_013756 [Trichomalopsis sarcophagae]
MESKAAQIVPILWANDFRPRDPLKAFQTAFKLEDIQSIKLLHTNQNTERSMNFLHEAVIQGYKVPDNQQLLELGYKMEVPTQDGRSPLQLTITAGHNHLVKYLIERIARINSPVISNSESSLYLALHVKNILAIVTLLQYGTVTSTTLDRDKNSENLIVKLTANDNDEEMLRIGVVLYDSPGKPLLITQNCSFGGKTLSNANRKSSVKTLTTRKTLIKKNCKPTFKLQWARSYFRKLTWRANTDNGYKILIWSGIIPGQEALPSVTSEEIAYNAGFTKHGKRSNARCTVRTKKLYTIREPSIATDVDNLPIAVSPYPREDLVARDRSRTDDYHTNYCFL